MTRKTTPKKPEKPERPEKVEEVKEEKLTPETIGSTEEVSPVEEKLTPEPVEEVKEEVKPKVKDYIKQYQYKKERVLGSDDTNPDKGTDAERTKETLLAQPRVTIMIPRDEGEAEGIPQSATINGYRLDLPKNAYIEVPEAIAKLIMDSHKQTQVALAQGRIDSSDKKSALRG